MQTPISLQTAFIGHPILRFDTLDSTNIRAKKLAVSPETQGTVVLAETQTAGRGRMTRHWHSPAGVNLYLSVVLFPQVPPDAIPQLAPLAAIALHKALAKLLPEIRFGLKWPNDIWSPQGKKLSGILCEATWQGTQPTIVVGVGINVNVTEFPEEIAHTATSLAIEADHPLDRNDVLHAFLNELEPLYLQWQQSPSLQALIPYWSQFDVLRDTHTRIQLGDQITDGTPKGILPDGRLVLQLPDGAIQHISAGDTHILDCSRLL